MPASSLRTLLGWRLAPSPGAGRTPRDPAVEGLRGGAALAVLFAHLTVPSIVLDPAFAPTPWLGRLFHLPHAAVLVFFVLSGYVIGLVTREPASPEAVRGYLVRRAGRLLPIGILAVILGYAAGPGGEIRAFFANLFFLQNQAGYGSLTAPLLQANANLWTLNYEAVYYLGFIGIWFFRPGFGLLVGACAALGILCLGPFDLPAILGGWSIGALFWVSGLALAWNRRMAEPADASSNWPAALAALVASVQLDPLLSISARLGFDGSRNVSLNIADIAFWPGCVWLLAAAAGIAPRLQRDLGRLTIGLLLATVAWRVARDQAVTFQLGFGLLAALVAAALVRRPITRAPLAKLAPVGACSFAIYALGAPIQHWVLALPLPSGSALSWILRLALVVGPLFCLAWFLEIILPRLRKPSLVTVIPS